MASNSLPSIRWGILGTGWVSTRFAADLLIYRPAATANHKITALGTSSQEKGAGFVTTVFPASSPDSIKPKIYTNYTDVYVDPEVDIVYIGTPHSYHKEQCLAAIAAGKHVLCEKPFTINAAEAEEVVAAAKAKGVYVMEAVWTRFFPLALDLKRFLHSEKIIGDIQRMTCDFSLDKNMETLPASHRYKDINLGGGALLDIGVYPLMWSSIVLDGKVGVDASNPEINATMLVIDGVDHEDVVVMKYQETKRIGVLTASLRAKGRDEFLMVEGNKGVITVSGPGCSLPRVLKIQVEGEGEKVIPYDHEGYGFYFEADAVAKDIIEGRNESSVVPLAESVRMMKVMDEIRRQGGVVYPQDR